MLPYVTDSTYALLKDSEQSSINQVKAAFVFPSQIQSLQNQASQIFTQISNNYNAAVEELTVISASNTVAEAEAHTSNIQNYLNTVTSLKSDLDNIFNQLQEYHDRAISDYEIGKEIYQTINIEKEYISVSSLIKLESFLRDESVNPIHILASNDATIPLETELINLVQKKVEFHKRVYQYVESGFNEGVVHIANTNSIENKIPWILSSAENAIREVELRIKLEEERKRQEEERKRQEEERLKAEKAKQEEEKLKAEKAKQEEEKLKAEKEKQEEERLKAEKEKQEKAKQEKEKLISEQQKSEKQNGTNDPEETDQDADLNEESSSKNEPESLKEESSRLDDKEIDSSKTKKP